MEVHLPRKGCFAGGVEVNSVNNDGSSIPSNLATILTAAIQFCAQLSRSCHANVHTVLEFSRCYFVVWLLGEIKSAVGIVEG
jgi:hypothetical protein